MKLIRKPVAQSSVTLSPIERADIHGMAYLSNKDNLANFSKDLDSEKQAIFKLADEFGESLGKRKVVKGRTVVVGYTTRSPELSLDFKRLFSAHPFLKKVLCSRIVDQKKVIAAISSGMITRKMLRRFTLKNEQKEPCKAVYVKVIKRKQNNQT